MVYLFALFIPLISLIAILGQSVFLWPFPLIYTFALIPLLDHLFPWKITDFNSTRPSDSVLYLTCFLHLFLFFFSLWYLKETQGLELILKSIALGISCGVIAINCGHELGHRKEWYHQAFAKLLLMTSFYMHFFTEHNKGHHRHVATPHDPASAKKGENFYSFLPRTLLGSLISAYRIDRKEVLTFIAIQFSFALALLIILGQNSLFVYLMASLMGIILLELVNYIEHYGLERKKLDSGRFEKVTPAHSWDSYHFFSSAHLFNLSLHSDHHALASKKFYHLKPNAQAPQMPSGYPGMMLLALIPPLWKRVMHKNI